MALYQPRASKTTQEKTDWIGLSFISIIHKTLTLALQHEQPAASWSWTFEASHCMLFSSFVTKYQAKIK